MNDAASSNEQLIPEIDRDFLREKEYDFLIIPESGTTHLVIKNFSFPEPYNPRVADILIIIPAGYPNAALDMFWTRPDVKLVNGSWPTAADQPAVFRNETWQRWSRHFTHAPWRPGVDNVRTFLAVIKKDLEKGI